MKNVLAALLVLAGIPAVGLAQTIPNHPPMDGAAGHPPMSGAGGHPPMSGGAAASPSQYRMPSDMVAPQASTKAGEQLVPLGQPAPTAPAAPALPNSGTVVSTTDAGGYSYIEVSGPEGNMWLAAPVVKVRAGDKIRFENGAVMRNFSSRGLGRTFPAISFVGQVVVDNK
jgi:hypothetical protein